MNEKGHCKHGEFVLTEGCQQCIAERNSKGTPTPDAAAESYFTPPEVTTAMVQISPEHNPAVYSLHTEAVRILEIAKSRIINSNTDLKPATDDLSLIANLKKAIEEKRKEYTEPLRRHLADINNVFKTLTQPLEEADKITRDKVLAFNQVIEKARREAAAIDAEKQALAKREAALHGGEITIDLTPAPVPPAAPEHIRTDTGMLGTMTIRKWKLVDIALVPKDLIIPDAAKITKLVKAGIGSIAGIEIYTEDTIRVNTKPV